MKNFLVKMASYLTRYSHTPIVLLALLLVLVGANLSHPVEDVFHEGEYLGAVHHIKAYHSGTAEFPLLVHGAIDYLPAVAAGYFFGASRTIAGTRLINTLLTWAVWLMFCGLFLVLVPGATRPLTLLLLFLIVFIWMLPGAGSKAVAYHQAFLNLRSLFLMPALVFTALCLSAKSTSARLVFSGAAGMVVALSLFWNYLDGLMALLFLCCIAAGFLYNRQFTPVLAGVAGAGLMLFVVWAAAPSGFIQANVHNVVFWATQGSTVFGRGHGGIINTYYLYGYFLLIAACLAVLAGIAWVNRDALRQVLALPLWFIAALALVNAGFAYADPSRQYHVYRFAWPLLITAFFVLQVFPITLTVNWQQARLPWRGVTHPRLVLLAMLGIIAAVLVLDPVQRVYAIRDFARLFTRTTEDAKLLPQDMQLAAAKLRQYEPNAYLSWTNDGVMAYLTGATFVGGIPNIYYMAPERQPLVVAALQKENPNALLYASPNYYARWGRVPMPARYPVVDEYLRQNYPVAEQIGEYIIISKKMVAAGG